MSTKPCAFATFELFNSQTCILAHFLLVALLAKYRNEQIAELSPCVGLRYCWNIRRVVCCALVVIYFFAVYIRAVFYVIYRAFVSVLHRFTVLFCCKEMCESAAFH